MALHGTEIREISDMVKYKLLPCGTFIVGDPRTGRTSAAGPGSMNATRAAGTHPLYRNTIPQEMIAKNMVLALQDGHPACPKPDPKRDEMNWEILSSD